MRDLIIIGAGPGGFDTALFAREHGLDVVLIEKEFVGGTCLNWGCIPTKALYHNAERIHQTKTASIFGVTIDRFTINYDSIKTRKEQIVDNQINNIHMSLKRAGVELITGTASIVGLHKVEVNGQILEAKNIILATGSKVRRISFTGDTLPVVHDSKDLLSLETFPKQLIVVGGGVIGTEMASIFNEFDCHVTIVEFQDEILPPLDKDIKKRARNLYKRKGIDIYTSSSLIEVKQVENRYVAVIKGKKTIEIETDYVLLATGRAPSFGGIDLDGMGLHYTTNGVTVNKNKQTSIPHIYAIGDVNGELMLAHKATYDGYKAVSHILNKDMKIDFDLVPSVVFSFPEIATVGKTEDQLQDSTILKNKYLYKTNGKAECMAETDGFIKMIADEDGHILGCHIIGAHASDLIHEVTAMMNQKIRISEYKNMIHAHPTLSEVIGECLKGL
jgi:dihydrolipoamide dehydrogenase